MYIDTHCHLQFSDFDSDRAMVIGNAKKAGVKKFILPGINLASSIQVINLAKKNPGVLFASIGFHPYEAEKNPDLSTLERILREVTNLRNNDHTPLIALGECGLDYHRYKGEPATGKKDAQKRLFSAHLKMANSHHLPVIMHCRDAFDDFFDVLDSTPSIPKGVIHCFTGGLQEVRMAQKRNLCVGVDGNLTYSSLLQSIVPSIPLAMILLETDTPYLTPEPHRGKRNEPKYIPLIAKKISELQQIPVRTVETETTNNTTRLFFL